MTMRKPTSEDVKALLRRKPEAPAPEVGEVQIEVRTGGFVGPDEDFARNVPPLFGKFLVEWSFDVPEEMYSSFQEALIEAERLFARQAPRRGKRAALAALPDGVSYLGTYAVVSGGEKGSGRFRTIWAMRNYAAFSAFGEATAKRDSPFAIALKNLTACWDHGRGANGGALIAQRAAGAVRYWD